MDGMTLVRNKRDVVFNLVLYDMTVTVECYCRRVIGPLIVSAPFFSTIKLVFLVVFSLYIIRARKQSS